MVTIDDHHIYHVHIDGMEIRPESVTGIIKFFFPPPPFYTKAGALKGTARHQWYHLLAQDPLMEFEDRPDDRIAADVEMFRKFMREVKPKFISGETPMYHGGMDYAGTPDMVCEIGGRASVVDFKPRNAQPWWKLQTAAYQELLRYSGVNVFDRFALRVWDDGYSLEKHDDPLDLNRWTHMVAAFHARKHYA